MTNFVLRSEEHRHCVSSHVSGNDAVSATVVDGLGEILFGSATIKLRRGCILWQHLSNGKSANVSNVDNLKETMDFTADQIHTVREPQMSSTP